MKLWQKDIEVNRNIEAFTTGNDRELDLLLAPFDVLGSIAHTKMLAKVGLLHEEESLELVKGLRDILEEIKKGGFAIEPGVEDIHSQVELLLTRRLGEAGKKIHSGRSRNDQVLVDLKLFMRAELAALTLHITQLFDVLQQKSEAYKAILLPGYTHYQVAMPSSFGLWLGAYAESLTDDLEMLLAAYKVVNKNPLGSAAGYGSSFPLDRSLTTRLLGFETLNYNVVYAQMTRGKSDFAVASALSSLAFTLNKLSSDATLYMCQNFGFITFPEELTTGSSIMPHKKNPDVFELIRAKTNRIKSLPNEINLLTTNMPSGYHRDWQLLKEVLLPAFAEINACIAMTLVMLEGLQVKEDLLKADIYKYLFTVERVNKLTFEGIPFRDAYRQVGREVNEGTFRPDYHLHHTHEGSLGNLCNAEIRVVFEKTLNAFEFEKARKALADLEG